MDYKIKTISANDTYPVRHPILRKGQPFESCKIEADDIKSTFHFGLFYKEKLVGVASFMEDYHQSFKEKKQYRLRGMAVLEDFQGFHFGKHLLKTGEQHLKQKNIELLWFNARIGALNFYKNNGYQTYGAEFDIINIGPHYVMHKSLK